MKNLSFRDFLSGCRKSDQWIFGCFMGLRTGIRSSVEGGTDSAMEALEWPQTITTEQSTFLVQLNLIRSSKISRADAEKSSKSFVITSETQLITIRDLLRVMLTLKSQAPAQRKSIMATTLSFFFYFFKTFTPLQNKHLVRKKSLK